MLCVNSCVCVCVCVCAGVNAAAMEFVCLRGDGCNERGAASDQQQPARRGVVLCCVGGLDVILPRADDHRGAYRLHQHAGLGFRVQGSGFRVFIDSINTQFPIISFMIFNCFCIVGYFAQNIPQGLAEPIFTGVISAPREIV